MRPATRTKTYAVGAIIDADGIKTSFATVAAPVALTVADWNGVAITSAGVLDLPRTVSITRSNNANQFSIVPIVLTGRRGGLVVTESLTPANDDGADVLHGTQPFDVLTNIDIPAQGGTGGTFTIGVESVCCPKGSPFSGVELASDGNLVVQYGDGSDAPTDTIPVVVAIRPYFEIAPTRILTASMADGFTVYLGG